MKIINLVVFILILVSSATFNQYSCVAKDIIGSKTVYSLNESLTLLEKSNKLLQGLPEDGSGNSFEERLKILLKEQIEVLENLIYVLQNKDENTFEVYDVASEFVIKQRELDILSSKSQIVVVKHPTQEEFNHLTESAITNRKAMLEQKELIRQNNIFVKSAPEQLKKLEKQKNDVLKKINSLNGKIATETNANEEKLQQTKLIIAKIEAQIIGESILSLQNSVNNIDQTRSLLNIELQIIEKRLDNISKMMQEYSKLLQKKLEEEHRQTKIILAEKEAMAAKAITPQEKFITDLEAKLAFSQKNKSALEAYIITQQRIFDEIDQRLQTEKEKMLYYASRLNRPGGSAIPADRIKRELQRLKKLKKSLKNILPSDYGETVSLFDVREFEIDDELQNFSEIRQEGFTAAIEGLSKSDKLIFEDKKSRLANSYRHTLANEKASLIKFVDFDQKIHRYLVEREDVLNEIERIVWSSMFWIQDGSTKNFVFVKNLFEEFLLLIDRTKNLEYKNTSTKKSHVLSPFNTTLYGILLFVVLPVLLFFLRKRLVCFATKYNTKTLEHGHRWQNKIAAALAGIVSTVTLPIYFYLASHIISSAGLPTNLSNFVELFFLFAGIFLLLFYLNRIFFRYDGIAPIQFGLNVHTSRLIYTALKIIIVTSVTLRLFSNIAETVFMLSAIPELLLFFELIVQGLVIWWVLRYKSPLVQNEILAKYSSFFQRYWILISYVIFSIIIAIWILAVTGYNYSATQFSHSLIRSIIAAFLLPQIYKLTILFIKSFSLKQTKFFWLQSNDVGDVDDGDNVHECESRLTDSTKKLVRILFYIVGVIIIANLWGLDDRALKTFDEIGVYKVTNSLNKDEVVSVGNLLRFFFIILITIYIIKNLNAITNFAVFSRIKIDEGIKYAILTIGRYTIFFISALFALSTIHLDLGRLGWLVAAMGVGLGFGLQEIVSNFFSGIILLIERPIRVDDIITIGSNIGTVTHINIRATTIVNFDRQELIVPNRMLITQEVTNWTRGDNILRVNIPVGVAYGSDINKVSSLLMNIIKEYHHVLTDPEPGVFFVNHGESSLDFELRVFIASPQIRWEVKDYINKEINRVLAENSIEIPFPQRDIHIK